MWPLSSTGEGGSVANRPTRSGLCLLAGFTLAVLLQCEIQSASAHEIDVRAGSERFTSQRRDVHKRTANANALVSGEAPLESKPAPRSNRRPGSGSAKGPYYVNKRIRVGGALVDVPSL